MNPGQHLVGGLFLLGVAFILYLRYRDDEPWEAVFGEPKAYLVRPGMSKTTVLVLMFVIGAIGALLVLEGLAGI